MISNQTQSCYDRESQTSCQLVMQKC